VNESIYIDSSEGKGGGQIIRSSLALSLVTGRPFAIENVLGGRGKNQDSHDNISPQHGRPPKSGGAEVGGDELGFAFPCLSSK
jgi:RNA 3'-terminal phosphate cyclase (ATP)